MLRNSIWRFPTISRTRKYEFLKNQLNGTHSDLWRDQLPPAIARLSRQRIFKLTWKKAYYKIGIVRVCYPKWRRQATVRSTQRIPHYRVKALFIPSGHRARARPTIKDAATLSRLLIDSVDPICSPPFWDQYVIGRQLVQRLQTVLLVTYVLTSQIISVCLPDWFIPSRGNPTLISL